MSEESCFLEVRKVNAVQTVPNLDIPQRFMTLSSMADASVTLEVVVDPGDELRSSRRLTFPLLSQESPWPRKLSS